MAWLNLGIELVNQAAAVDIECFEDVDERRDRDAPVMGPADDVEIFLSGFDAIENAVEEEFVTFEGALQEPEVAPVGVRPRSVCLAGVPASGLSDSPTSAPSPIVSRRPRPGRPGCFSVCAGSRSRSLVRPRSEISFLTPLRGRKKQKKAD
jgi:hypothetical protein